MKSTTLNSALFTDLDDSQSEAVNGGGHYSCYKPKYDCYYEKPKYECYKPKYECYTPKYECYKPKYHGC
jgi:hypothetical protein